MRTRRHMTSYRKLFKFGYLTSHNITLEFVLLRAFSFGANVWQSTLLISFILFILFFAGGGGGGVIL